MPMNAAKEIISPSAVGATPYNIAFPTDGWYNLISFSLRITADATGVTRTFTNQFLDAQGNVIYEWFISAAPSNFAEVDFPNSTILPYYLLLPPGSTFKVQGMTGAGDTVSQNVAMLAQLDR